MIFALASKAAAHGVSRTIRGLTKANRPCPWLLRERANMFGSSYSVVLDFENLGGIRAALFYLDRTITAPCPPIVSAVPPEAE